MAFPFFKKGKKAKGKKEHETMVESERPAEGELPVADKRAAEKSQEQRGKIRDERVPKTAPIVLLKPHVTEKATRLAEGNQYTFQVFRGVNKIEIKNAIEELYGIDVTDVRIVNVPPKKRRRGRIEGWRKGYKKAIVRIKEGQKIEVLPR